MLSPVFSLLHLWRETGKLCWRETSEHSARPATMKDSSITNHFSGSFEATVTAEGGEEVNIEITYTGYSDPGRVSGPPEDCYPPEGEIELEIEGLGGFFISDSEYERLEELAWEHAQSAE